MVTLGFPGVKGSSELMGTELTGLWRTRCLQPSEASLAWAFFCSLAFLPATRTSLAHSSGNKRRSDDRRVLDFESSQDLKPSCLLRWTMGF